MRVILLFFFIINCTSLFGSSKLPEKGNIVTTDYYERIAWCNYKVGHFYREGLLQYLNGFTYLYDGYYSLQNSGNTNNRIYTLLCTELAGIKFNYQDYQGALSLYLKWYLNPKRHDYKSYTNYNAFALTLANLGYHEYAIQLFHKCYHESVKMNHIEYIGFSIGNCSLSLKAIGKNDLAKKFLYFDYRNSVTTHQYASAANALLEIAEINLNQGDIKHVAEQLLEVEQLYNLQGQDINWKFYHVWKMYHETMGNHALALSYMDKAMEAKEDYFVSKNTQLLKNEEFQLLEDRKIEEKKQLQRNYTSYKILSIAIILFILILIALLLIHLGKTVQRSKNEKSLFEKREKSIRQDLQEKNRIISDLRHSEQNYRLQIANLESTLNEYNIHTINLNKQTIHASINKINLLTEESWIEFKTLFSSAYPNFIENLFIQVGKLSHGELRLACMIRLNLTTNEMADMIGISQDSIKKGLLRFKNKLKFDTQADLLDFIYALPT